MTIAYDNTSPLKRPTGWEMCKVLTIETVLGIIGVISRLLAVYGIFMNPLGWRLAGLVWGWALAAFVITDFIKIYFQRRLERPIKAEETKLKL